MTDTVKFRLIGERQNVKAMITALDPVLDFVTDWRIFPQRNGIGVSAYLEARPRHVAGGSKTPPVQELSTAEQQAGDDRRNAEE
ncbi:hypothetical protein [Nocardia terpenica]|uniref:Uncharacterized protein n=1 Tax=Nocardia terpenica TaxID=455432 RepID=A0A6G9Z243_9NOCA|nr:hypothetical protein [Nocardia terpenica]QIS19578.1 hypothetical protein F6W96_16080 [Nocardia terpenica]